jgi:AraC-like DNA-binding protein
MKRLMNNKAVLRELFPYIIYVAISMAVLDVGILCVLSVSGENMWDHKEILLVVNFLMLIVGSALVLWQFFRYILPAKNVMRYMGEEDSLVYRDVSDEIIGSLEDYKECKVRLNQMESIVQMDFIDKLLNAEYKSKPQLLAEAESVGIELYGYRYVVIVAGIFNNVADEDVDAATIYESTVVLDYLKLEMGWGEQLHNVWFRKISYRRMMMVLQLQGEFEIDRLYELREKFLRERGVNIFWGVSRLQEDPLYLWKSREEAYRAVNCCDTENVCLEYSEKLESGIKYYLTGSARNNLQTFIQSGNAAETQKIIRLLKDENCEKRKLSHSQFIALNGRLIRLFEKFQKQDKYATEDMIDLLNDFVLADAGDHEAYFERLEACCMDLCERYGRDKQDKKNQLAVEIKEYIDENYHDCNLGLTQVGTAFNISDSYVSLIFKEYIGVKFSTYVEEVRIRHASELLMDGVLTVREISEQTGYTNEQSFRRAFKKVKGISPKEARILEVTVKTDVRKSS